ncbi:MAG: tetratricopeptide repeat protein [Gemmatimonadota bacterium]|jgi:tetratricopeptide (TPR) repeat protein
MNRLRWLLPALALGALLPVSAAGQKYKDSKYTKDAEKFIGLAMTRPDRESRQEMYRQALAALDEGFVKDADNAKLWFVAGQAHAGAGDYVAADSCFTKAVTMYPEAEADAEAEREAAWLDAFQTGVELMDQNDSDGALAVLVAAQTLYNKRPEALLNIGSIYANRGDLEQAERAFEQAITAVHGDMYEKLDSAGQAQWDSYAELSTLNIAQMRGTRGVNAFSAGDYDTAAELFSKAIEINPYSRDYYFNRLQATYAKASELEKEHEAAPEDAALRMQLVGLYQSIMDEIPKVKEFDPTSENLELIRMRAVRRSGELQGDTAAARQSALQILTDLEEMPVEVRQLSIVPNEDGTVTVTGEVRNRTLPAGSNVGLAITLMGSKGETVGSLNFSVPLAESARDFVTTCVDDEARKTQFPDELTRQSFCQEQADDTVTKPFEQSGELTGSIAGWKYAVTTG